MVHVHKYTQHHSMKPRDVRERLRGRVDPEVGQVLVGLAEDNSHLRQDITRLAQLTQHCINVVELLAHASGQMRSLMEQYGIDPKALKSALEHTRQTGVESVPLDRSDT